MYVLPLSEFMSVYLEGIEARILSKAQTATRNAMTFTELKVMDIQIDNYSETAYYPVVLHSFDSTERKQARIIKLREERLARINKRRKSQAPDVAGQGKMHCDYLVEARACV
jgi:hypothetical protein